MNWDVVTAISEIIGAVCILATLIYLSVQIRDNTKASQAASRLIITQDCRKLLLPHLDTKTATTYREGIEIYPNMSYEENILFSMLISDESLFFQGVLALFESGQLEKETYESYLTWYACIVSTPGGAAWWGDSGKTIFVPHMVSIVEKRISMGGLYDLRQLTQFKRKPSES